MKKNDLIHYSDYLLKIAINRSDTIADAQDLAQETMLVALITLEQGKDITNPKAWFASVLNHKYYDTLRKKYNLPTVSYDTLEDMIAESNVSESIELQEEARQIRRSLAFLTELYREVMVRFYMKGESIKQIAKALCIPENTVKSRLSTGRKNIRKDMDTGMDSYTKQSYEPDELWITSSGKSGLNNEPFSLINSDRIIMNLLLLAYEKPISVSLLSKAIGIATAFVEPIVESLVQGELMKRVGDKVYTDFIIYKEEDRLQNLHLQKELSDKYYQEIWKIVELELKELYRQEFYMKQNVRQKKKLETFFVIKTIVVATLDIRDVACAGHEPYEHFPDRPNGGKWYAMGNHYEAGYDASSSPYSKYEVSGESAIWLEDYHNTKCIGLYEYDTEIGRTHSAYNSRQYMEYPMYGENVLKMLYAISTNDMEDLGVIGGHCLEQIENFVKLGYLIREEGKVKVDIPVLKSNEKNTYFTLIQNCTDIIVERFNAALSPMIKKGAIHVPPHLKSVPEWQKYLWSCAFFPMMVIFKAKEVGLFLKNFDDPCPSAFLCIEE